MSIRNIYADGSIYPFPAISTAQDGQALTYDDTTKSVKWGAGSGPSPTAGAVIGTPNQIVSTPNGDDFTVSLAPTIEVGSGSSQIVIDSTSGLVSSSTLHASTLKVGLESTGYQFPATSGSVGQYLGLTSAHVVDWLDGAQPGSGVVESIEAGSNIIVTGTAAIPHVAVATAPTFSGLTVGEATRTYTFPADRASANNMSLICNADGSMVFATIGGGGGSTIDSIVPVANETTAATVNNICTVGLADSVVIRDNLSVGNVLTIGADSQSTKYSLPQTNGQDGQALVCHSNQTCTWETVQGGGGSGNIAGTANQVVVTHVGSDSTISLAPTVEIGVDGSAGQITLDSTSGLVSADTLQINTIKVGLVSTGYTMPEVSGALGQYLGLTAPNTVSWLNGAQPGSGVVESLEAGDNIIITGTAAIPQVAVAAAPTFTGLTLGDGATTYTFPVNRASANNMSLVCNSDGSMVFATIGGGGGSTIDSIVPVANETTAATVNNICTVGLADSVVIKDNLSVGNVLTVGADSQSTKYSLPQTNGQDGQALVCHSNQTCTWETVQGGGGSGNIAGTANQVVVTHVGSDSTISLAPTVEIGVDGSAGQITLDSTSGLVSADTLQINTIKVGLVSTGYTMPEVSGALGQYLGLTAPNTVSWLNGAQPGSGVVESLEAGDNIIITGTAAIPQVAVAAAPTFTGLTLGDGATTYTFPVNRASANNMSLVCNSDGSMVFATIGGGGGSTIDSIVPVANETTAATVNNICTVGLADSVVIKDNLSVGNVLTIGADVLSTQYALPQTNGQEGQALVCHNNQTCTWEDMGGSGGITSVIGTESQINVNTVDGTAEVSLPDAVTVGASIGVGTTTLLDSQTLHVAVGTGLPYSLPLAGPASAGNAYSLSKDSSGQLSWVDTIDTQSIVGTANQVNVNTVANQTTISLPPQITIQSANSNITVKDTSDNSKVVVSSETVAIWPTNTTYYQLPYTVPQVGQLMTAVSSTQLGWSNAGSSYITTDLQSINISFGQGSTNPTFNLRMWSAGGYGKGGKLWCTAAQRFQWNGNLAYSMYSPPIAYPDISYAMSDIAPNAPVDQILANVIVSEYDAGGGYIENIPCYLVMRSVDELHFRMVIMVVDQNNKNFQAPNMYALGPCLDNTSLTGRWAQYSFTYA